MGCEVTPATCQLGMSSVEYGDLAGETEEAGKAAIAARLSPAPSPSYRGGMQPQADDRPEDLERRRHALRWVESFAPSHERAARSRRLTLELLRDSPAPFDRSRYDPGHITASGLVLSPTGERVLLVFHNRLQLWLQPGGHVEPSDNNVLTTAVREVREETGISVLTDITPILVAVDFHQIPATDREPAHFHHDLMFRLAAAGDAIDPSAEVREALWCPIEQLPKYHVDEVLLSGVERAIPSGPP